MDIDDDINLNIHTKGLYNAFCIKYKHSFINMEKDKLK